MSYNRIRIPKRRETKNPEKQIGTVNICKYGEKL